MRTSTSRRRRREAIVRWVSKLLLIAAVGTAAFFGVQAALDKFFFKNAEYTLRRISFNLDEILTREEASGGDRLARRVQHLLRRLRESGGGARGQSRRSRTCASTENFRIRSTSASPRAVQLPGLPRPAKQEIPPPRTSRSWWTPAVSSCGPRRSCPNISIFPPSTVSRATTSAMENRFPARTCALPLD